MMKRKCLIGLVLLLLLTTLSSCDYSIVTVRYDFVQEPRKIYIVNVDTELDFTGATIISTSRDGTHDSELPFPEFPELPRSGVSVEHSIDFTTIGVYPVVVTIHGTHEEFEIHFYVEVVEEK